MHVNVSSKQWFPNGLYSYIGQCTNDLLDCLKGCCRFFFACVSTRWYKTLWIKLKFSSMCPSRNVPDSPPISKCECSSLVSKFSTHIFLALRVTSLFWFDDVYRISCRALELWGWSVISSYFILLLILLLPHFMPCREGGALLSWRRSEGFFTCHAPHSFIAREPEYTHRNERESERSIDTKHTHTHTHYA